ncbi:CHRD domain-containing protein [Allokutzneria sp. A3M-2-11 16]|uniref:CHRD domain-containing protein n=1 Tax=Allokutzneria sp. A3M-2-11 16 TaxID=2962043 RepID=UPI0020B7017F|nr:CHRD domain-containing protein [Allokutzneria sp. A3M-2-11 16]MCP3801958.1 CHRD domain-containing protein [Allokutzneria sp. A3M-2-11 16]
MRFTSRVLGTSAVAAALALVTLVPAASASESRPAHRSSGIGIGLGLDLDLDLGLGRSYSAVLTGEAEVPGPGDPDGRGYASVRIGSTRVCATLSVNRIGNASAAHIHRGPAGTSGPVVVHLKAPTHGRSHSCTDVSRDLAKELRKHPSHFYVNVHNSDFPAGAVRGQLHR